MVDVRGHPICALVSLLIALEAVLLALPFRTTVLEASRGPCPEVSIIGVRATREPSDQAEFGMGPTVSAVAYKLARELWRRQPSLTIKREGVPYPAALIYPVSRNRGAKVLAKMMGSEVSRCPGVRFVLIGLSQGAEVIELTMSRAPTPSSTTSRIAAVVLYGDPSRLPNQSFEHGTMDSHSGIFANSRRVIPAYLVAQTWAFCFDGDEICGNHLGPLALIWSGTHTRYVNDDKAAQEQGVNFAADKVMPPSTITPLWQTALEPGLHRRRQIAGRRGADPVTTQTTPPSVPSLRLASRGPFRVIDSRIAVGGEGTIYKMAEPGRPGAQALPALPAPGARQEG
jgi:hypothetical protein